MVTISTIIVEKLYNSPQIVWSQYKMELHILSLGLMGPKEGYYESWKFGT